MDGNVRMYEGEETDEIVASELKAKLAMILKTLDQEHEELKQFYHQKISELYDEISEKEETIAALDSKVEHIEHKCLQLEWKIVEKNSIIDQLHAKIQRLSQQLLKNSQEQVSSTFVESSSQLQQQKYPGLAKRINISEYFLSAMEDSKNANADLSPSDNFPHSLLEMLKTDCKKTCVESDIDCESPPAKPLLLSIKSESSIKSSMMELSTITTSKARSHNLQQLPLTLQSTFLENEDWHAYGKSSRASPEPEWKRVKPYERVPMKKRCNMRAR